MGLTFVPITLLGTSGVKGEDAGGAAARTGTGLAAAIMLGIAAVWCRSSSISRKREIANLDGTDAASGVRSVRRGGARPAEG